VVIGLIAIIAAISIPLLLSFVRSQRTQGAARELVALLNQARQLAITRNTSFSLEVEITPQDRLRFCSGTATPCPGGTVWIGAGTDTNGWMRLAERNRILLGPTITFSALGSAINAGRLRVQDAQGTSCLDVVVSVSGRIRTETALGCP
ncbi:MAG: GspH/FimT family pseudopilin, partial [Candidatus Rokuibacteriota bacterium]